MQDNVISVYVGTQDAGAMDAAPDAGGSAPNNMKLVTTNIFDLGNPIGGNNWLTRVVRSIDGTHDYSTDFGYDFRNRRTETTAWIVNGSVSVITLDTLDNKAMPSRPSSTTKQRCLRNSYPPVKVPRRLARPWPPDPGVWRDGPRWYGVVLFADEQHLVDAFDWPVKDMPAGSQGYTKTAYDLAERLIGR